MNLMTIEGHVRLVGAMLLALAGMNVFMPGYLGWKAELARVSLLTRQAFVGHFVFLVLVVVLLGVLSLCFAPVLMEKTVLARAVLLGLSVLWWVRLGMQLFFYSPALWRGKRFETVMHVLFTGVWAYFGSVYGVACARAW